MGSQHRRPGEPPAPDAWSPPDPEAGGRYETLASGDLEVGTDRRHDAAVRVDDVDGGVRLRLSIDGEAVLEVVDADAPLTAPGRVSLRSDAVAVSFDDVEVQERE